MTKYILNNAERTNILSIIKDIKTHSKIEFIEINRKIICLCGSTKFIDQYREMNFKFTMEGHIVLTVGALSHSLHKHVVMTPEDKENLDALHLDKIRMADEIFVIDVGSYIGESTRNEIAHAMSLNKVIRYYSIEITGEQDNDKS